MPWQFIAIVLTFTVFGLFAYYIYFFIFSSRAKVASAESKLIMRILEILNPTGDYAGKKIYLLGCKQPRFLREFAKIFPKAAIVGFENKLMPFLFAKIQTPLKFKNIKIIKEKYYRIKMDQADIIYCLLKKETLANLEKKFKFECKNKCMVICHQSPLPHLEPIKVIELQNIKIKKGGENKVFLYEI